MQILFLNLSQTILLGILTWLFIQLIFAYCSSKIPLDWLNPDQSRFQYGHPDSELVLADALWKADEIQVPQQCIMHA